MGRIFIMLNVGFVVVSSMAVEIQFVVLVLEDVEIAADIVVAVVVEVLVVFVVAIVVVVVVEVLVVLVVVDLGFEEERFPHLVLQGQHLPVRMLTHLFFLGWYLHSLKHKE